MTTRKIWPHYRAQLKPTKANTQGRARPVLVHPLRVASILAAHGMPEEPFCVAALLHDGPEPGKLDLETIQREFGDEVARLVRAVTPPTADSWHGKKTASIERLKTADESVLILACADKLDNLISIREDLARLGHRVWERMGRSPQMQTWYYRSLAEVFEERLGTGHASLLAGEFCAEVRLLFGSDGGVPPK